jgi:hypothetical protein
MILNFELNLASFMFSPRLLQVVMSLYIFGRSILLLVQVLKGQNLFARKQAATGKFAVPGLTGAVNWVF